jgi:hypothetical protein
MQRREADCVDVSPAVLVGWRQYSHQCRPRLQSIGRILHRLQAEIDNLESLPLWPGRVLPFPL